jgi:hypothetical protein
MNKGQRLPFLATGRPAALRATWILTCNCRVVSASPRALSAEPCCHSHVSHDYNCCMFSARSLFQVQNTFHASNQLFHTTLMRLPPEILYEIVSHSFVDYFDEYIDKQHPPSKDDQVPAIASLLCSSRQLRAVAQTVVYDTLGISVDNTGRYKTTASF